MKTSVFKQKMKSILLDNYYDREIGGQRRGKIDRRKLWKVEVNNDRVFKKRTELKNKQYHLVLIDDISGSMQGSPTILAAKAIADTYKALRGLVGIETAVLAYNDNVELVKGWEWDVDPKDLENHLANLMNTQDVRPIDPRRVVEGIEDGMYEEVPESGNTDFLAIDSARELLRGKGGIKIILFYSDGGASHEELLHREIRKAQKEGCICLAVGIFTDEVSEYFKQYKVIEDIDDLYPATVSLIMNNVKRG